MQADETFDLDAYLASKGALDFEPELGRKTVTLVPGSPGKDRLEKVDVRDLLFPDRLVKDLLFDDAPYEAYPLIPPAAFGWKEISRQKKAQTATAILAADIFYDEHHPLAGEGPDFDLSWSRATAWYLITRIAGNVRIKVRLNNPGRNGDAFFDTLKILNFPDGYVEIDADDLISIGQKEMAALRNAYMSNFSVIGIQLVRAHTPCVLPDLASITPHLSGEAEKFLECCRTYIRRPKPQDNWTSQPSWLTAFFAFGNSTQEQRCVLYLILATDANPRKAKVSLGDQIIGSAYVDATRGQGVRETYVVEPVLDMLSRGLVAIDPALKSLELTEHGRALLATLKPVEAEFRYREFFAHDGRGLEPGCLPTAQSWILEFFGKLKTMAAAPAETAQTKG